MTYTVGFVFMWLVPETDAHLCLQNIPIVAELSFGKGHWVHRSSHTTSKSIYVNWENSASSFFFPGCELGCGLEK